MIHDGASSIIGRMRVKYLHCAFLLLVPAYCFGNVGIPVIALTYPGFAVLLLPIIITEYFIIKSIINIEKKPILVSTVVSNLASTLIGVPLAWAVLLILEMITTGGAAIQSEGLMYFVGSIALQSAWMLPPDYYWMLPAAIIVNLIPAFFLSKYSEYIITKKMIKTVEKNQIKKAVFKANNVTYGGLFAIAVGYLIITLVLT